MAIYKPSELLQFLEGLGIHPKKALSQNFLIDGNIIRKIIASTQIQPGQTVVEIGPGPGSLTEGLLAAGADVLAIEKDDTLAKALNRLMAPEKKLEVVHADVLEFPIEEKLKEKLQTGQKAKVIANLPYHITTPILVHLVKLHGVISELVVMVQEEVARRFVAKPNTKDYASITVFLNYYGIPKYEFGVSKYCFYPSPKVDSAVVRIELRKPPPVSNEGKFFEMTRRAFEQRRKMLRNSLRDLYEHSAVELALERLGKTNKSRPEELSLEELILLFEKLQR